MAKGSGGGSKSNGRSGLPKMVWINHDLTKDDKTRLTDKGLFGDLSGFDVGGLAEQGFKYSLSPDEKHDCYVASLTQKRQDDAYYNHCLVGRGSTPTNARVSLLYRHLVLAEEDWSFFGQGEDGDGFDMF